jgi:hypothetical protein
VRVPKREEKCFIKYFSIELGWSCAVERRFGHNIFFSLLCQSAIISHNLRLEIDLHIIEKIPQSIIDFRMVIIVIATNKTPKAARILSQCGFRQILAACHENSEKTHSHEHPAMILNFCDDASSISFSFDLSKRGRESLSAAAYVGCHSFDYFMNCVCLCVPFIRGND